MFTSFSGIGLGQSRNNLQDKTDHAFIDEARRYSEMSVDLDSKEKQIVGSCLNHNQLMIVIECLLESGVNKAKEIVLFLKQQLVIMKKRICQSKDQISRNRCEELSKQSVLLVKKMVDRTKTPIEKGKTHVKKRTELRNLVKMICSKKKDKTCSKLLKRKLKERCMKKYQLIDSLDSLNCKLKSIEKMQFQQQVIQNEMKI